FEQEITDAPASDPLNNDALAQLREHLQATTNLKNALQQRSRRMVLNATPPGIGAIDSIADEFKEIKTTDLQTLQQSHRNSIVCNLRNSDGLASQNGNTHFDQSVGDGLNNPTLPFPSAQEVTDLELKGAQDDIVRLFERENLRQDEQSNNADIATEIDGLKSE